MSHQASVPSLMAVVVVVASSLVLSLSQQMQAGGYRGPCHPRGDRRSHFLLPGEETSQRVSTVLWVSLLAWVPRPCSCRLLAAVSMAGACMGPRRN